MAKVKATLVVEVVYDNGGYDDFDAEKELRSFVDYGVGHGLLSGENGPVTIDTYEVSVNIEDKEEEVKDSDNPMSENFEGFEPDGPSIEWTKIDPAYTQKLKMKK